MTVHQNNRDIQPVGMAVLYEAAMCYVWDAAPLSIYNSFNHAVNTARQMGAKVAPVGDKPGWLRATFLDGSTIEINQDGREIGGCLATVHETFRASDDPTDSLTPDELVGRLVDLVGPEKASKLCLAEQN